MQPGPAAPATSAATSSAVPTSAVTSGAISSNCVAFRLAAQPVTDHPARPSPARRAAHRLAATCLRLARDAARVDDVQVGLVLRRLLVAGLEQPGAGLHRVGLRDLAAEELDVERGHAGTSKGRPHPQWRPSISAPVAADHAAALLQPARCQRRRERPPPRAGTPRRSRCPAASPRSAQTARPPRTGRAVRFAATTSATGAGLACAGRHGAPPPATPFARALRRSRRAPPGRRRRRAPDRTRASRPRSPARPSRSRGRENDPPAAGASSSSSRHIRVVGCVPGAERAARVDHDLLHAAAVRPAPPRAGARTGARRSAPGSRTASSARPSRRGPRRLPTSTARARHRVERAQLGQLVRAPRRPRTPRLPPARPGASTCSTPLGAISSSSASTASACSARQRTASRINRGTPAGCGRTGLRAGLVGVAVGGVGEAAQQISLLVVRWLGISTFMTHVQVPAAAAAQRRQAASAQAQDLRRLSAGLELDVLVALERRHRQRPPERGVRERHVELRDQVLAVALEARVRLDAARARTGPRRAPGPPAWPRPRHRTRWPSSMPAGMSTVRLRTWTS